MVEMADFCLLGIQVRLIFCRWTGRSGRPCSSSARRGTRLARRTRRSSKRLGFLLRVEGSRLFFQIRDRYWPDSEMGASPPNDLAKLRDIFRWEYL